MSDVSGSLAARLEAAAALLASGPARNGAASDETGLLHFLGYQDTDAATADSPIRMLRAAAQLRRLFQLPVPDAPGLIFFGGEADPAILDATLNGMPVGSLAGSGRDPRRAFESCVGEGIEYLSQFVRPDDQIERATATEQGRLHGTIARRFLQDVLAVCTLRRDFP